MGSGRLALVAAILLSALGGCGRELESSKIHGKGSGGLGGGGLPGTGGSTPTGGTLSAGGPSFPTDGFGGEPPGPEGPCTDSDDDANDPYHEYRTRGTATGVNGTFEDRCDEYGNLVEQECEVLCYVGVSPDAGTLPAPEDGAAHARTVCVELRSGHVVERSVQCGEPCQDGGCYHWCPARDETLTVTAADDDHVRMRTASNYTYTCQSDPLNDHCADPALIGRDFRPTSVGCEVRTVYVTLWPDATLNQCRYECTWEPPERSL